MIDFICRTKVNDDIASNVLHGRRLNLLNGGGRRNGENNYRQLINGIKMPRRRAQKG